MTTRQKLIKMLMSYGMSERQAISVMELAIPALNQQAAEVNGIKTTVDVAQVTDNLQVVTETDTPVSPYNVTWDRPADEYPAALYSIWFTVIKPIGLKWIDDNIPQAWFRPMFI